MSIFLASWVKKSTWQIDVYRVYYWHEICIIHKSKGMDINSYEIKGVEDSKNLSEVPQTIALPSNDVCELYRASIIRLFQIMNDEER